jgi:hypothetical protein
VTTISHTRPAVRQLRQALVLLHMAAAFGWLAISGAMLLLITYGLRLDDPAAQLDVLTVAAHLDDNLLADFSFMTVYTGLMLAGLTPWGYTRFWWVTVKLVMALGCALGGRAIFTRLLADATTAGHPIPGDTLILATTLMIAAIAFMAWVARTKPWGPIGRHRQPARHWAHPALWALVLATPIADYVTGLPLQAIPAAIVLGHHALAACRNGRK